MVSAIALSLLVALGAVAAPTLGAPSGFRLWDAKTVHIVPEGGKVVTTATEHQLVAANGTILLTEPRVASSTPKRAAVVDHGPLASRQILTSGDVLVSWENTAAAPIIDLSCTFSVPGLPAANDGQQLQFDFGLESNDNVVEIFLFYGYQATYGGGNYWSIAAGYAMSGGILFLTPPQTVQPGLSLTPTLTNPNGDGKTYLAYFDGIAAGPMLNVETTDTPFYALLEFAASAASVADFPSGTQQTLVTALDVQLFENPYPPVTWTVSQSGSWGLSMTIVTNGYHDAELFVSYPSQG